MSAAQAVPRTAAPKASAKPTTPKGGQAVAKVYTQLFFEYSDGKGCDLAALQAADGAGSNLAFDQDGQTKWEIGLGSSLKLNCASPTDESSYIARLPKGFQVVLDARKGERFIVGHAGGTSRDFWYRSVAEFVPHLLWLGTPAPHDRSKCSCEPCKKMLGKPKAKETKRTTASAKRKAAASTASRAASALAPAAAPAPVAASGAATPGSGAPNAAAKTAPPTSGAPPLAAKLVSASEVPPVTTAPAAAPQAAASSVPENSIYRLGEMVWYGTQTGVWRIGLIAARDQGGAVASETDTWVVAPLGHVLLQQESCIKATAQMKPFHAFSLPSIDAQQLQGKTFAEVDWPAFVQQFAGSDAHRRQVAGLEASKMAARDVNASYSTFNRTTVGYGGVFLGPEMVRVGDGVRVRRFVGELDGSVDIMEVKRITDAPDGQRLAFYGDVWRLHVSPLETAAPPASSQPKGAVFVRQLETYNEELRLHGGRVDWMLVEQDAERAEVDVHGRFYVTFDLLPEMRQSIVADNPPDDGTTLLNLRLRPDDSFYLGRRESRKAAFGDSVSVNLDLGPGVVEG